MRSNLRPSAFAIDLPSEVLPTPGGPTKRQDRAPRVGLQLAHREVVEDPLLDLLDVVVVGVEDLARVRDVEVVLGASCSTAGRRSTRGRCGSRRARRPPAAASRAATARARPACARPRAAPASSICSRSSLISAWVSSSSPSSLLDRLQLLAQEVLALGLVHLGLDLGLDLRAELHHLELAREDLRQAPQPLGDVALLEQLLLLLDLDPQRAGDHVAERLGVVDVGDRDLQLLGQVGDALDDAREGGLDVARERLQLRRQLDRRRAPRGCARRGRARSP